MARGYIGGQVVATHIVHPPGGPRRIELQTDYCGRDLAADGSDWIRVYAKVCDARGTVCPTADDLVEFSVEGEGQVIGASHIGANPVRAEAGIATALIQSNERAGSMIVKATAFGLAPGQTEIISVDPDRRRPSILQPNLLNGRR
jgi:beta-galactosidase